MPGPSKGGRTARRPVDRPLFKHTTAVIGGIIHDTYDPSRAGTLRVYGYFTKRTGAVNVM
jgi:hypothetical protein